METVFPIIHNHGKNFLAAERHCFSMFEGGWAAKLKHTPAVGWQVVITAWRGV